MNKRHGNKEQTDMSRGVGVEGSGWEEGGRTSQGTCMNSPQTQATGWGLTVGVGAGQGRGGERGNKGGN